MNIAIVDDHIVLAEALSKALILDQQINVQGTYSIPQELLHALSQGAAIDLVLSDFSMPSMNGIDLLTNAKKIKPELHCVLLTMHDLSELRYRCRRAGIEGYISKTSSVSAIQDYILSVRAGHTNPPATEFVVYHPLPDNVMITPSELEVIRCVVCMELSSKATAEFLHRSHHTIEQHRKNIYAKLGIDSIAALTKYAIEAGICATARPNTSY